MTTDTRPPAAPVLLLRQAAFGYAGRPVVSNVSLQVRPGEVVALVGPNGSGKSTLVRGLLGLTDLLAGSAELLGAPLGRTGGQPRVGYVPQRHTVSGSVRSTVREVVAVGRLPHRPWWRRASAHDRALVQSAIDRVGLGDRADTEVSTLSGGQQRRVLIARALAGEPDLLVMDEPTAGVDAGNQDALVRVLHRLADSGVTMLVVTHELDNLAGIVDRVVGMAEGHLCFDGSVGEYARHRLTATHRHDGDHHHDDDPEREAGSRVLGGIGSGPLGTSGVGAQPGGPAAMAPVTPVTSMSMTPATPMTSTTPAATAGPTDLEA